MLFQTHKSKAPLGCVFCLAILATSITNTGAQDKNNFNIPLTIKEGIAQFSGQLIATSQASTGLVYTSPANNRVGQAPGGVLLKIERLNNPAFAYQVSVDSDGDGNLANDSAQVVGPNSSIIVRVNRHWKSGKQQSLPYQISYSRRNEQESFLWIPNYRAEGRLRVKNCDSLFVVLDLDSNGQFDQEDLPKGTSIGLDRNGDARIWGRDEYLSGAQIIEYCNEAFLVKEVAVDGTSITLSATSLRVPTLGEQLPAFSFLTMEGETINSQHLRGKVYLLDFWASWCKPCVEKFSLVKRLSAEYKNAVSIIAVNVDEEARLPTAKQIVATYRLTWPHVMSGKGEADPVWKMFGGMEGNRLAIPLYVVVDNDGRLRYAGNGGENLSDLRVELKRLLVKK